MSIKRAYIFDLDNTIYPVSSIGYQVFSSLFKLIKEDGNHADDLSAIKQEIMRRPFQQVAEEFGFSSELEQKGTELLINLEYCGRINPFPDYAETRKLPGDRFLVTTGFLKLQQSKIEGLGIRDDFKEIRIVDPSLTTLTKKDVFAEILDRYDYAAENVLVIGDDLQSEIKAALELGIRAVLYDKNKTQPTSEATYTIADFSELHFID